MSVIVIFIIISLFALLFLIFYRKPSSIKPSSITMSSSMLSYPSLPFFGDINQDNADDETFNKEYNNKKKNQEDQLTRDVETCAKNEKALGEKISRIRATILNNLDNKLTSDELNTCKATVSSRIDKYRTAWKQLNGREISAEEVQKKLNNNTL